MRNPHAETLRIMDSYPCLYDALDKTPIDPHYFYQLVWAMERIVQSGANHHVDIGSDNHFIGALTTQLPVIFIDRRPFVVHLPQLLCVAGDILALPLGNDSTLSLSCLHVAEHIGLGRYGDALNPLGTRQTCAELKRVLAPGGNLFFSLPVGRPRVCFNAHRIHSPTQVLGYFGGLDLVEFSAVDDQGKFLSSIKPIQLEEADYSCGLFWFQRN